MSRPIRPTAPIRQPTSIRLTEEVTSMWEALAKRLGVSKRAVLEMSLRKLAEREGLR